LPFRWATGVLCGQGIEVSQLIRIGLITVRRIGGSRVKDRYTVALCDILGFRELVQASAIDRVMGNLAWFSKALHHSLFHEDFPEQPVPLTELQAHPNVGVAWFSDTALLFTRRDDDDCLQSLLQTLNWLLFETMMVRPVRLRCGVSYGEAFIDPANSLFVGAPIVDAYDLERDQQWSGGALTEDAVRRLPAGVADSRFADWPVVPYTVPLKSGPRATLAVDWTFSEHPPGTFLPWSPSSLEPTQRDWKERQDTCEKWQNTERFHRTICRTCSRTP
jgi:hypothetical protein